MEVPTFNGQELNPEQALVFNHVMKTIESGQKLFLFVSGTAGTGKSFLIGALVEKMSEFTEVCAPSALAAKAIGGSTIHSLFRFDIKDDDDKNESTLLNFPHLRLLIIDEISQCGAQLFDRIERRLRQITRIDEPFGDCHVVLFGDLLQIPPVKQAPVFESLHWSRVSYMELGINQRQSGDFEFAQMLQRWRFGRFDEADIQFLKGKVLKADGKCLQSSRDADLSMLVDKFLSGYTENSMILSPINASSSRFNNRAYKAQFGDACVTVLKEVFTRLADTSVKTLQPQFTVAIGGRVMITQNLPKFGLLNGEFAKVEDIFHTPEHNVIHIDIVSEQTGRKCRIMRLPKKIDNETQHNEFPLLPAYAATYHKAQGQTLEQVFLEVTPNMSPGLFFVGASRVQHRDGLFLISKNFQNVEQFILNLSCIIRADPKAVKEIARLNSL
ncbi:hypothetical protein CRE_23328 [Caenorhabditis remanei]|uniref:ATP-dependent DNA helicase n=1 Tax=Caenorhabditis remanei TaxID=31234 RepID=E3MGW1_CAERE|nr:hypothetical protein CRE_23328 [Caenorhabditis remanei]